MTTDNRDLAAAAILDRLIVEDSGATVLRVVLPARTRTAGDLIERVIRLKTGDVISPKIIIGDLQRLAELPGISRSDVRYSYNKAANEADVQYLVYEEKSSTLSIFMSGTLHAGPYRSGFLYPDESDITGALIYGDSNLFGRAWDFSLITAGVYNLVSLSREGFAGTPLDVSFEAEGLFLPGNELSFYDEHRKLMNENTLTSRYLRGSMSLGLTAPFGVYIDMSYEARKDWFTWERFSPASFVLPSDLLHTARISLELDMQSRYGPANLIPAGFRFGVEIAYDYYQNFREWGSPDFRNMAPENGLGTLTYGTEAAYGTLFLERFNAGIALGAYGGTNYYTRTYRRLRGSAGPCLHRCYTCEDTAMTNLWPKPSLSDTWTRGMRFLRRSCTSASLPMLPGCCPL